uniref:Secreted protein n=1 Tax=Cacopsylla melanoneura TaxID=428564 RepID=A0A8D9EZA7_9HEMI
MPCGIALCLLVLACYCFHIPYTLHMCMHMFSYALHTCTQRETYTHALRALMRMIKNRRLHALTCMFLMRHSHAHEILTVLSRGPDFDVGENSDTRNRGQTDRHETKNDQKGFTKMRFAQQQQKLCHEGWP